MQDQKPDQRRRGQAIDEGERRQRGRRDRRLLEADTRDGADTEGQEHQAERDAPSPFHILDPIILRQLFDEDVRSDENGQRGP